MRAYRREAEGECIQTQIQTNTHTYRHRNCSDQQKLEIQTSDSMLWKKNKKTWRTPTKRRRRSWWST